MSPRSPETGLLPRAAVVAAAAALGVGISLFAASETDNPKSPQPPEESDRSYTPKHIPKHLLAYEVTTVIEDELPPSGLEIYKREFKIPRRIPRDRYIPEPQMNPPESPPRVHLNEFINIDLKDARQEVKGGSDGYGCTAKHPHPEVPVYTKSKYGTAIEVGFSYWPGDKELTGHTLYSLPKDINARESKFYAFFNGKGYELASEVTPPGAWKDNIHLAIPEGVPIPKEPDLCILPPTKP